MCLTCGCHEPFNAHQDARNITFPDLQAAAEAAGITVSEAVSNLEETTEMADPVSAFHAAANKGREDTPGDVRSTERLMRYWSEGEGAAQIGWGSPGDYDRCLVELGKHVGPKMVHGLCANLHHRALGIWPATHAAEERGHKAAT